MNKPYCLLLCLFIIASQFLMAQPATLDQSFGNKGMSISDSARYSMQPKIALQPDGKILVATNAYNRDRGLMVLRYKKNGTLDSTFGINGTAAKIINPSYELSTAIALQPDGKILLGGRTSYNAGGQTRFVVIRFTSQGQIDSSFAINGVHILPILNASDALCSITKLFVRPDGKILAGGNAYNSMGVSYFAFEQLKPNGTLDSTFGVNGFHLNPVFTYFDCNVAIDSSKKVIAGGQVSQYNYFGIRRYLPNGTVDNSFGYNGISDQIPDFRTRDVQVEPNGKLVFFGQSLIGSDYRMTLVRFDSLGKLDRSFGDTGVVHKSFGGTGNNASSLLRQPDGKYIIIGWSFPTWMIRYNNNGTVDSSFGKNGIVNTSYPGAQLYNSDAALQADGKIVLAATVFSSYLVLTRYEKNAPIHYNLLTGKVFFDKNSNGLQEPGEPFFSNARIITTKPGNDTITTIFGANSFQVYVDTGSYSTRLLSYKSYYSAVPVTHTTSRTTYYNIDTVSFAMQPIPGKRNLAIFIVPLDVARPGFPNKYKLLYTNQGTDTASGTIEFIRSEKMTFISSVPAPIYQNGDTLRWSYSGIKPLDTASVLVNMTVMAPPVANIGDTLKSRVTISSDATDLTPADNSAAIFQIVRGAYDPNDKREVHGGKINPVQISSGEYLYYTIRFQNTGNDTAFNVYIRDTLSTKLDWNSFEVITASHKYEVSIVEGRCLFTFANIKLVDSIKNEPLSHGYIVYRIKPSVNIAVGDVITNLAAIYFDYNLPIFTNTEMTTVVADPLPLRLLAFTAKKDGRANLLQWNTANEVNVEKFEVERSHDGRVFGVMGAVSAGSIIYQYKDEHPLLVNNYYRLKIKDKDGAYAYSPIVVLHNDRYFSVSVFPNPAKEDLYVNISLDKKSSVLLQVVSAAGKVLLANKKEVEGTVQEAIDIRALASGTYYLKISSGKSTSITRFVKM